MKIFVGGLTFLLLTSMALAQSNGTWELYPPQAHNYSVSILPPIKADGTSVRANNSTIPVQYAVFAGYGPVMFSSYQVSGSYSYLAFTPSTATNIEELSTLSAVYLFQSGTCHGGSMRWSIGLANGDTVYAYYGNVAQFNDCTTGANNVSGTNLLSMTDGRFEIQGDPSNLYVPWVNILAKETGQQVTYVALVLDGGWGGDQVLVAGAPQNVTVGTANWNATFSPQTAGVNNPICPTNPATIQVSLVAAAGPQPIDADLYTTPADVSNSFRIVDCKYIYNLSGKSLGKGVYKVDAVINGTLATQAAPGTVFTIK